MTFRFYFAFYYIYIGSGTARFITVETRFLSECLAEAFCILRGILKCTKICMSLQLDDAGIGF